MNFWKFSYKRILKPILFLFDPELIHELFVLVGSMLGATVLGRSLMSFMYGYHGPDISKEVDGIRYKTPVLLAAGFDYNGRLTRILASLGFGGEEIGSITARPCKGNPKPRLGRLPKSGVIRVNKGLKNDGADVILKRLQKTPRVKDFVIGVSIARTNDKLCTTTKLGIEDYVASFKKFTENKVGDYYTINISCPNAYCGEEFLVPNNLYELLSALGEIKTRRPVYLKMPINLEWKEFKQLIDVACRFGFVKGFVIGNLNKNYKEIDFPAEAPKKYRGGLSGKACFTRANRLIRKTRDYVGKGMTIIGVGGIFSPLDAQKKFEAGADLVQLITGMIFEGPQLIREIDEGVAEKIKS